MKTFYIIHYGDNTYREAVIITDEKPTPEFIEENRPYKMEFRRTIKCLTTNNDLDRLPLNEELRKHI